MSRVVGVVFEAPEERAVEGAPDKAVNGKGKGKEAAEKAEGKTEE